MEIPLSLVVVYCMNFVNMERHQIRRAPLFPCFPLSIFLLLCLFVRSVLQSTIEYCARSRLLRCVITAILSDSFFSVAYPPPRAMPAFSSTIRGEASTRINSIHTHRENALCCTRCDDAFATHTHCIVIISLVHDLVQFHH